jgi:hypothetical protein
MIIVIAATFKQWLITAKAADRPALSIPILTVSLPRRYHRQAAADKANRKSANLQTIF